MFDGKVNLLAIISS